MDLKFDDQGILDVMPVLRVLVKRCSSRFRLASGSLIHNVEG